MIQPQPSSAPPSWWRSFHRYAGAGALGTALHYLVLLGWLWVAPTAAVAATTAGALLGAGANYWLNHRYSFASRRAHRTAAPRFAVVAAAGVLLNGLVVAALVPSIPVLPAQLSATGAVLLSGFVLNRYWTFA